MESISTLSNTQRIRNALRTIATEGYFKKGTNVAKSSQKVFGYVCKIHDDSSDELYGTIDVQEYCGQKEYDYEGFHEGVQLTAIQDNTDGITIIPLLYSEVLLTKDPETGIEYVAMYSHALHINMNAHESIKIGVFETEEYDTSSADSADYTELEKKGNSAYTYIDKENITQEISVDNNVTSFIQQTKDDIRHEIREGDTAKSAISQNAKEIYHELGSSTSSMTDGLIELNGGNNGGLINIEGLVQKLNNLENDINMIKNIFTAWSPVMYDGGSALKAASASWAGQTLIPTQRGDFEDTAVTH